MPLYLGIDVGSTTVKIVLTDSVGALVAHDYCYAHGQPARTLHDALVRLSRQHDLAAVVAAAVTGSGGTRLAPLLGALRVNELVAQTQALDRRAPQVRTVIEIGGQDSKLLRLEPQNGHLALADFVTNTLCAAGTGSFLDQQAERLGLSIDEFAALPLQSTHPARIAGRCTVFAKSDMVHLQQRGVPLADIVAGLCLAVARNLRATLGAGRALRPPLLFQGGVAGNAGMVWALETVLGLASGALTVPPQATLMAALGAADLARAAVDALPFRGPAALANLAQDDPPAAVPLPPLSGNNALPRPSHESGKSGNPPVALGIDVGSVGTKAVLLDAAGCLLAGCYRPTAGQPLDAARRAMQHVLAQVDPAARVRRIGVTGSARELVGQALAADHVCNEIAAQARAARAHDPAVDTVFEIGGQDSKFIRLQDEHVVDMALNRACAAGTGAFLEEQAQRLNIDLADFGALALTAATPVDLGPRCTVFMHSDLVHHQQRGARLEDLLAGLAYSIAANYLDQVVQRRPLGQRLLFQGGVANNPAVVAALTALLGRPLVVPPHPELSGAVGAALLAQEQRVLRPSTAPPSPAALPDLFAERETLLLQSVRDQLLDAGHPRIGIPRALTSYDLLPFWSRFFQELGWQVVLSPPTSPAMLARAAETARAETCTPVKLLHSHVLALAEEGVERIFVPALVNRADPLPGHGQAYLCPFVQAAPHLVQATLADDGLSAPLLHAPFHFLWPNVLEGELVDLARRLGAAPALARRAWRAAQDEQRRFETTWQRRGAELLAALPAVVLVGRSYTAGDPALNAGLPDKLRRLGLLALPLDLLPLAEVDITDQVGNMFWHSGQRILAAARLVRSDPRLQAIYLSHFACGPDSFLLSFFRQAMETKPFLELELDDHSGDAGVLTRVEAFAMQVQTIQHSTFEEANLRCATHGRAAHPRIARPSNLELRIYLPPVCDPAHALAAALRHYGLDAQVLPPSSVETLALGRELCLGRECLPCYTIVGDVVQLARQPGFDPARAVYLLPTSAGPCRLGQFHDLLRLVLRRLGLDELRVVAPSAENGYQYPGLGVPPLWVGRLAWQGLVAINLLEKFLHSRRPYERTPGAADRLYQQSFAELLRAVEEGGGRRVVDALAWAAQRWAAFEVDEEERPLIGLVGELYLRLNPFTNQDVIRQVEALGGEVRLAPMMEWLYYANHFARFSAAAEGRYLDLLRIRLAYLVQQFDERRLLPAVTAHLPQAHEPSIPELMEAIRPYFHPLLRTEAPVTVGKAVDLARHGADGILNVLPFTCMPGTVVSGLAARVRTDLAHIPWLDLVYDGQGATHLQTRLEAFVHQAREQRRKKSDPFDISLTF